MKKIISAIAISAIALTAAFADISFAITQGGYIYNKTNNSKNRFSVNGYKVAQDCVVFSASNDAAGVVLDIDPSNDVKVLNPDKGYFDAYYGYVNVLDGALKLQSGVWTTRNVQRMKQDAGQWQSQEFERFKPGVVNGTIARDIANVTNSNLAFAATYTLDPVFVTAAISSGDYGKYDLKSGFGLEVGANIGDVAKVNVIVRNPEVAAYAAGLYVDTTAVDKLDVMAGFAFGLATEDNPTAGEKYTEFGVDLRARYALSDKVAVTTMNNVSYKKADSADDATISVWDMVSLARVLSDSAKFTLTGEWEYADLSVNNSGKLSVIPGIEVKAGEEASLTAGVVFNFDHFGTSNGKVDVTNVAIPFILHVEL